MVGWTQQRPRSEDDPARLASLGGNYCLVRAEHDGLVAARGTSAGPSLYIRTEDDTVLVSTEFGALARLGGTLDVAKLAALSIGARAIDDERTVLREVRRVVGYTAWRYSAGRGCRSEGRRPAPPEVHGSADDLADALNEVLDRAIERAATGHCRVGVMVGGIDSSIVLARAHALGLDLVPTTFDFSSPTTDSPHVARLCEHLGLGCVRVIPEACRDAVRSCMVVDDAPCGHPAMAMQVGLQRAAYRVGATVLLSGTGGDEVLGGRDPTTALVEALRRGDLRAAREVSTAAPGEQVGRLVRYFARSFQPTWLRRQRHRRTSVPWAGPVARAERERLLDQTSRPSPGSTEGRYALLERHPDWQEIADERDRMNTSFFPPVATPLLDDEVVRFTASLRPSALFQGGMHRGLARHAARGILPSSVRLRLEKAEFEPALAAMSAPLSQFATLSRLSRLSDLGIVEPGAFRTAYQTLCNDPASPTHAHLWLPIWAALSVESYLQGRS